VNAGRAPDSEAASADFWAVYEASFESLRRASLDRAVQHPEMAPIATKTILAADLPTDDEKWKKGIADAALGAWSAYEAVLRERGAFYARAGVSFRGWYDVVSQLTNQLVAPLVAAYGDDPPRLAAAVTASQHFGDRVMGTLIEAYLETTRTLVAGAEARNQAVLGAALDPILVVDSAGVVLDTNPATTAVFGYARGEIIGKTLMSFLGSEQEGRSYAAALHQYPGGRSAALVGHRREAAGRRKDGSVVPLEIGAVPTRDVDGTATFTVFLRDASERYRVEQMGRIGVELSAENVEIREASRLKSEFLANMSHELRTPLNSIIGFTELLHDGEVAASSPEHDDFLGDILRSARHLLQLINDILDLSKVEAGKLTFQAESIDLPVLIAEVIATLRQWASARGVSVHLEVAEDLGPVRLDPGRLRQVLYNYLSNALKFTSEEGAVTIRAFAAGADHVTIEVEDTGIGIDAAEVGRLFVKFEQLDSGASKRHAGTGLGLALTKRLAEAQGGTVGVRSVPGRGSVFSVTLPRDTARPTDVVDAGDVKPSTVVTAGLDEQGRAVSLPHQPCPLVGMAPSATGHGAILVVDDDPASAKLVALALQNAGYDVMIEHDAASAMARALLSPPRAVILDLQMPQMDGFELLRRLRSHPAHARLPVVVWTVRDLTAAERQELLSSAQTVLPKGGRSAIGGLLAALRSLLHKLPAREAACVG
jgi:PAS domain S-box-containing protein